MSDYTFYFSQLDAQAGEGQPPETTPGHPHSGFYRVQRWAPAAKPGGPRTRVYDPVAIWWENGQVYCAKPGFVPTHADEIDQLFSQCCRNAVTEETYRAVVGGAAWPDQVEERAPAKAAEPERLGPTETQQAMYGQGRADDAPPPIGDNSGAASPSEIMAERIQDALDQFAAWLKEIGGKIGSQEQADKAANFASLLGELEKEADTTHTAEKAPWLAGGREVDGRWKPLIDRASIAKRKIKNDYVAPFLVEQERRAKAEAEAERKRLAEEQAKREAEAAEKGEEPPPPMATVEPAKVGAGTRGGRQTSLRTVKVAEIENLMLVAGYFAAMETPPPDFRDVCRKLAERVMKAGSPVPGAKLVDQRTAS